jgi:hypothetical protein
MIIKKRKNVNFIMKVKNNLIVHIKTHRAEKNLQLVLKFLRMNFLQEFGKQSQYLRGDHEMIIIINKILDQKNRTNDSFFEIFKYIKIGKHFRLYKSIL